MKTWDINDRILCAGGNNKSGCKGDSGSPFLCRDEENMNWRFHLQGVVKGGSNTCKLEQLLYIHKSFKICRLDRIASLFKVLVTL